MNNLQTTLFAVLWAISVSSDCKEIQEDCLVCYGDTCYVTSNCKKENCIECNIETGYCIACSIGFFDKGGECLDCSEFGACLDDRCSSYGCFQCQPGSFEKKTVGHAFSSISCVSCSEKIKNCLKCNSSQVEPICEKCSEGSVLTKFGADVFCMDCPQLEDCPTCNTNHVLMDMCFHCHGNEFINRLSPNCHFSPLPPPVEISCTVENCDSCAVSPDYKGIYCDQCERGFTLGENSQCYQSCEEGQYFYETSCFACSSKYPLCKACTEYFCSSCAEDAVFVKRDKEYICQCKAGYLNLFGSCQTVFYLLAPIAFTLLTFIVLVVIFCRRYSDSLEALYRAEQEMPKILRYLPPTIKTEGLAKKLKSFESVCRNCKKEAAAYKKEKCNCFYCAWCLYLVYLKGACLRCKLLEDIEDKTEISENMLILKENMISFEVCAICLTSKVNMSLSCGNKHKLCIDCFIRLVTEKKIKCHICRVVFDPIKCTIL